MLSRKNFSLWVVLCTALMCWPKMASAAEGGGAIRVPAIAAYADVGYFTYKSKLASSNDTGLRYGYGFQIFGGSERALGAAMRSSLLNATFALNENKITDKTQTFIFNYRLGYVYAGVAFGTSQMTFSKAGVDAMDAYANTIGGNAGGLFPFGRGNTIQTDITVLKPSSVKDTQQRSVSLGLKIEADTFLTFALSRRFIDLMLGFKYTQHTASVGGEGGAEKLTIPSVGFRFGANL